MDLGESKSAQDHTAELQSKINLRKIRLEWIKKQERRVENTLPTG